jgi:hypothetical protein
MRHQWILGFAIAATLFGLLLLGHQLGTEARTWAHILPPVPLSAQTVDLLALTPEDKEALAYVYATPAQRDAWKQAKVEAARQAYRELQALAQQADDAARTPGTSRDQRGWQVSKDRARQARAALPPTEAADSWRSYARDLVTRAMR